jgi:preprotein translocase subunit SecG
MTFIYYSAFFIFILISAVLCLVILVQESKSMGLGASFGGDAGESLFGTSTADVLKKFTAYLACAFVVSCLLLSLWTSSMGRNKVRAVPESIEQLAE